MKKPAVLFDFDGTLMDTEPAIMSSYGYLFRKYRTIEEFTIEKQVSVLGPALSVMMKQFFPEKDPDEMVEEYRKYQRENLRDLIKPMPYAMELLAWMKEEGWQTGVISTRYSSSLIQLMDLSGMTKYIDVTIGHDQVVHDKPDPEGILRAAEMLGADSCIYVGDSATDILAGHNAGAGTIAFVSNEAKRQSLIDSHPDFITGKLSEIRKYLEAYYE
ncbi:MAG: HAD-IA family hydrolase [Solobacterium sp.]|nr:HAD-IA family hydrolase [Solobacterium sp.]